MVICIWIFYFVIVAAQLDLSPPQIDINTSNLKISQEMQIQSYDEEQYNDKFSSNNTDITNTTNNDEKINSFSNIEQTHILTESIDPEQSLEGDRSLKPSRIPILKTKHLENTNSISSSDLSNKCTNSSVEDYEALKILNASCIPTSPITGKKYRSPLSMQHKVSDRSKKIINGTSNNNASCDNLSMNVTNSTLVTNPNMEGTSKTLSIETSLNMNNSVNIKNEANSGRSTPILSNNKFPNEVTNSNVDKYKIVGRNESLNPERKPRFKWMFGPHKNANVVCFFFFYLFSFSLFYNNNYVILL